MIIERNKLSRYITFAVGQTSEPLPGRPLVEILGANSVLVENHQGISEYTRELIAINVEFGSICIAGTELSIQQMTRERLVICGCVQNVTLRKGEKR